MAYYQSWRTQWDTFWLLMPPSLVLLGIWFFVHWLLHPNSRPITYQQLVHQGTIGGSYKVSGGFLDLNQKVQSLGNNESDSYVALRGSGETGNSPIHVLVQENTSDINNRITNINEMQADNGTMTPATKLVKWKSSLVVPVTVIGECNPLGKFYNTSLTSLGHGIGPNTIWIDESWAFDVWYIGPALIGGGVIMALIGKRLYPALYGVMPPKKP